MRIIRTPSNLQPTCHVHVAGGLRYRFLMRQEEAIHMIRMFSSTCCLILSPTCMYAARGRCVAGKFSTTPCTTPPWAEPIRFLSFGTVAETQEAKPSVRPAITKIISSIAYGSLILGTRALDIHRPKDLIFKTFRV